MPFRDDNYTNPDKLRLLYLNPQSLANALGLVDPNAIDSANAAVTVSTLPSQPVRPIRPIRPTCPAFGQTIALCNNNVFVLKKVELLTLEDTIYNPITGEIAEIASLEHVHNVECARVVTLCGAEKISSLSAPILQGFSDTVGVPISEILDHPDDLYGAVVCEQFDPSQSEIAIVTPVGKRSVVKIELKTDHRFWSGTNDKLIGEHNAKAPTDGGDDYPLPD